ncbi:MAG TPA: peptide-methionine (S)-S-oxide reductase MsrA [Caulobacteraceae bacterium]|jgi:peptide-methionine (S)-S-oxide reductase|nr:peptide-methionine (S)-S-oxide reductase MsrA [Caulobacteraceae bacterium]
MAFHPIFPALAVVGAGSLLAVAALSGRPAIGASWPAANAAPVAAPAIDSPRTTASGSETAILSGGCFWGVQGVFEHVRGVRKVVAGYAGGAAATASYELVSTGTTGHAESVRITFDPSQVSYGQILRIFFSVATDPTQVDRQYPDEGPQYRSEIFYSTPRQHQIAQAYVDQLNRSRAFSQPIATRIDPATGFYAAEGYHQDFLARNPGNPYIAQFDMPKVEALAREFPAQYAPAPITLASR